MLGRRDLVTGTLALLALSACDVDDLRPPEDDARPTPSPTGPSPSPEPDADVVLAADAAYEISVALVAVDAVRREFPRLRARLQPLARMHRAHLEVLEPPADRSVPPPTPARSPADALAGLRTVEDALRGRLAAAAVDARSGALARLLASVAASVSQHTAVALPAAVPGEGAR